MKDNAGNLTEAEIKMNPTKQQLEILEGKCSECVIGLIPPDLKENYHEPCLKCSGTGQGSIEIKKEWVECKCNCHYRPIISYHNANLSFQKCCNVPNSPIKGKIPKYKVGQTLYQKIKGIKPYEILTEEEFNLLLSTLDDEEKSSIDDDFIKLKIISDNGESKDSLTFAKGKGTEDKQRAIMVR